MLKKYGPANQGPKGVKAYERPLVASALEEVEDQEARRRELEARAAVDRRNEELKRNERTLGFS